MLLHAPNLTMYPEQYKTVVRGGCIDGAVKFAHAPMGARYHNHEFELIGRQAVVHFNMPGLKDVKSDRPVFVGKKDGIVKEIRFDMKAYESAFIELITK